MKNDEQTLSPIDVDAIIEKAPHPHIVILELCLWQLYEHRFRYRRKAQKNP